MLVPAMLNVTHAHDKRREATSTNAYAPIHPSRIESLSKMHFTRSLPLQQHLLLPSPPPPANDCPWPFH